MISKSLGWLLRDELADGEGRYLFLKGTVNHRVVTLANIYAPNTGQCEFLEGCLQTLSEFAEGLLLLEGI